jgi:hypothetical protein
MAEYWWGDPDPETVCPSCHARGDHTPGCRLWMLWTTSGVRPQDEYAYVWGEPRFGWEPREVGS